MPDVLRPGDPGFEVTRQIFNAGAQATPALICRCHDAADVQAALREANGRPVSIRAGGHSVGGFGVAEGGVVIDVRPMRTVTRAKASVTVGAGCLWGDLLTADRATPGAFDPRVGVAGFTLGGGYGMLTRLHGLGADALLGAKVVLADGTCADADADLLWALRGAGANFGVVTELTLQTHPIPPLTVVKAIYPLARARDVLRSYRAFVAGLGDATTVYAGLLATQGDALQGIQLLGFHFGPGDEVLDTLRAFGPTLHHERGSIGYAAAHVVNEATFPLNHHHAWRAHFLAALSDAVVDRLADFAAQAQGHEVWAVLEHLGGAMGRVPPAATAFAHRRAAFGFVSAVKWAGSRPTATLRLQDQLHDALRSEAIGTYVNYLGSRPTPTDIEAAYGANLLRLRALKQRYDSHNVFRHNVNVSPA